MKEQKNHFFIGIVICFLLFLCYYLYEKTLTIPDVFPTGKTFTIKENESLKSISYRLKEEGYIDSALLFRAGISYLRKDTSIQLGGYIFTKPESLSGVIRRFVRGSPDTPLLAVTVPEGSTSSQIVQLFSRVLPQVSLDRFNQFVAHYKAEGKLFPSTYFLLPSFTEEDIIKLMLSTFTKKVQEVIVSSEIPSPLTDEHDVLVLASLLEGEANNEDAMKKVSGILITRLKKGMPLQVDVAKETYKKKGLPLEPINNPGLMAIDAVLHPIFTEYLYYITGDDGKMYYAKTFEEHKKNIKKYLK